MHFNVIASELGFNDTLYIVKPPLKAEILSVCHTDNSPGTAEIDISHINCLTP